MNFTYVNESNLHNEIYNIFNNISNLDFKSRIRKFENVLNFIHENKKKISSNDIKINTQIKETNIFFEMLTNENIQNFMFEYGFNDDLENAETYDDLKEIYASSSQYIKILDRVEKMYSNSSSNSNYSGGINCSAFENAISLGTNSSSCSRVMSRCNDYGGLKSADYPFNPF